MKKKMSQGKSMKIQSIALIASGFVLIFALLSATILYTYYDRSLVHFIQGIGREEKPVEKPKEEPTNPALLMAATATAEYADNLYILSDSMISGIASLDVSIKDRCYFTQFISSTNYNEAVFTTPNLPDKEMTLSEFAKETKPGYLLLNFSGTGLTMQTEAITNLYNAILDVIFENSPKTVVILSGPLPVFPDSNVNTENVVILDTILSGYCWHKQEEGKKVFYLPSPASFFDSAKTLKEVYRGENNTLNEKGALTYYDYVLKHPVPENE